MTRYPLLTMILWPLAVLLAAATTAPGAAAPAAGASSWPPRTDPAAREREARARARAGHLLDPGELRCEARATADPGEGDPCHGIRTVRVGTRHGEPVTAPVCEWCGTRAIEIRASAGDRHAARDLAGHPTPRRPWLERP